MNPDADRVENQHLMDLVVQAEADPDAEFMQPTSLQVEEATEEYLALGLKRESIRSGAIEMRAQELYESDVPTRDAGCSRSRAWLRTVVAGGGFPTPLGWWPVGEVPAIRTSARAEL